MMMSYNIKLPLSGSRVGTRDITIGNCGSVTIPDAYVCTHVIGKLVS